MTEFAQSLVASSSNDHETRDSNESESSSDATSPKIVSQRKTKKARAKQLSSDNSLARPSSQKPPSAEQTNPHPSESIEHYVDVLSRGRGAKLTLRKVLLVFISMIQMSAAAGQDNSHPAIQAHMVNMILLVALCVWVRYLVRGRFQNGRTSTPIMCQDSHDPRSRGVYVNPNRCPPSLQPLPGNRHVCVLASTDHASDLYVANLGFEPPDYLHLLLPRLPNPRRPNVPAAVMTTGEYSVVNKLCDKSRTIWNLSVTLQ